MDPSDPLKEFLKNTGWSCDELLQKLLQVKQQISASQQQTKDDTSTGNRLSDNDSSSQAGISSKTKPASVNTRYNVADKDFSDTDEEEQKVIISNKRIIDEIVEDTHKEDPPPADIPEKSIVIELDSEDDEEDDNFEEECSHSTKQPGTPLNKELPKEKNSNVKEKISIDSISTIVIEDDDPSDTEKTAAERTNEMFPSLSMVRTDSADDLQVLSIEDVYETTPRAKGSIHVVSESDLSMEDITIAHKGFSNSEDWLPKISSIEGGIDLNTKFKAKRIDLSLGDVMHHTITQSILNREEKLLGITDNKVLSDMSNNENSDILLDRSSTRKDDIAIAANSAIVKERIPSNVPLGIEKADTSSNVETNEHLTTCIVTLDLTDVENISARKDHALPPNAEHVSGQKPVTNEGYVEDKSSNSEDNITVVITDKVKCIARGVSSTNEEDATTFDLTDHVESSSAENDQKPSVQTADRDCITNDVQFIVGEKESSINALADSCPKNSIEENWQIPKILSVEGGVENDEIQMDTTEASNDQSYSLLQDTMKIPNGSVASSGKIRIDILSCSGLKDSTEEKWQINKNISFEGAVDTSEIPDGKLQEAEPKIDTAEISNSLAVSSEHSVSENEDIVETDVPIKTQDPSQDRKIQDPRDVETSLRPVVPEDSSGLGIKIGDTVSVERASEVESLLGSSEFSSTVCTVDDSNISFSESTCHDEPNVIGDSAECCEERKPDAASEDVSQNQDTIQPKTNESDEATNEDTNGLKPFEDSSPKELSDTSAKISVLEMGDTDIKNPTVDESVQNETSHEFKDLDNSVINETRDSSHTLEGSSVILNKTSESIVSKVCEFQKQDYIPEKNVVDTGEIETSQKSNIFVNKEPIVEDVTESETEPNISSKIEDDLGNCKRHSSEKYVVEEHSSSDVEIKSKSTEEQLESLTTLSDTIKDAGVLSGPDEPSKIEGKNVEESSSSEVEIKKKSTEKQLDLLTTLSDTIKDAEVSSGPDEPSKIEGKNVEESSSSEVEIKKKSTEKQLDLLTTLSDTIKDAEVSSGPDEPSKIEGKNVEETSSSEVEIKKKSTEKQLDLLTTLSDTIKDAEVSSGPDEPSKIEGKNVEETSSSEVEIKKKLTQKQLELLNTLSETIKDAEVSAGPDEALSENEQSDPNERDTSNKLEESNIKENCSEGDIGNQKLMEDRVDFRIPATEISTGEGDSINKEKVESQPKISESIINLQKSSTKINSSDVESSAKDDKIAPPGTILVNEKEADSITSNKLEESNIKENCSQGVIGNQKLMEDSVDFRIPATEISTGEGDSINKEKVESQSKISESIIDLQKSSTKINSSDVETSAKDDKIAPPGTILVNEKEADAITTAESTEEYEVEYRLVDPRTVESPLSAKEGIHKIAETLSDSSEEEYVVEALEDTPTLEDADEAVRVNKGTSHLSIFSGDVSPRHNAIGGNKSILITSKTPDIFSIGKIKTTEDKMLLSNNSNTMDKADFVKAVRKKLQFYKQRQALSSRQNTDLRSSIINKMQSTVTSIASLTGDEKSPDMPKKLSMADILQRKLDKQSADSCNVNQNPDESQSSLIENGPSTAKGMPAGTCSEDTIVNINCPKDDANDLPLPAALVAVEGYNENDINAETTLQTTLGQEVEPDDISMTIAARQAATKSDENDMIDKKGPTEAHLIGNTKQRCQVDEDAIFAIPKLPPLRASTSKEKDMDIGNVEDIRANLKLQLNSLRSRKRPHVKITTQIDGSFFEKKEKDMATKQSEDKTAVVSEEIVPQLSQDQLYTQTNELGLVILDVQGGVDLDDSKTDGAVGEHQSEDVAVPKEGDNNDVADLVRQIIGKKCEPRIRIRKDLSAPPPVIDDFEIFQKRTCSENVETAGPSAEPMPSTSTAILDESALLRDEHSRLSSHENSLSGGPNEEISPFISNTLDEYLTGDAQLNVSYTIPKCGAEEGIRELHFESEPVQLVQRKAVETKNGEVEGPVKKTGKKVRTLAQKRKLLEKQMAREKKQKEKEQEKTSLWKQREKVQKEFEERNKDRSYVIADGKKIYVQSTIPRICILNLDEGTSSTPKVNVPESPRKNKISLLENLHKRQEVHYSPGPLSKKTVLPVSGTSEWTTEVKTLPNVFVEVVPKLGQPLPAELMGRIDFDVNIGEDHVEFALTALKTKNPPLEPARKFVLPVKYKKNQQQIIVRKKIPPPEPIEIRSIEDKVDKDVSHGDDSAIVAKVIDDMIRYVEIKELGPSLIKEDDYGFTDEFKLEKNKEPSVDGHLSILKRSQRKRSHLDCELLRLSCKIVSVEVENEDVEKPCDKPFCRLGCVCKSLNCENTMIFHCQKEKCIFTCTCPKERATAAREHRVTLPAGTNVLSVDTVHRIEDEAKKHLARVEREFTQTIIQTNNRTIVVGATDRSKTRRIAQVPKKYNDYVEHTDMVVEDNVRIPEQVEFTKQCVVIMTKLNLDGITPFCLRHNLYDCFCGGKSEYLPKVHLQKPLTASVATNIATKTPKHAVKKSIPQKGRPKKIVDENTHNDPMSRKRSYSSAGLGSSPKSGPGKQQHGIKDTTIGCGDEGNASNSSLDASLESPTSRNKKVKLSEHFEYSEPIQKDICGSARTMGVFAPNIRYKKFSTAALKNDFVYNYSQADLLKIKMNHMQKKKHLEVDILKQTLLSEYLASQNVSKNKSGIVPVETPFSSSRVSKRKQTLEVRKDVGQSPKTDDVTTIADVATSADNQKKKVTTEPVPIFDGEIIINESSMELLRKMGPRTVLEGYARLLPWRALSDGFKNGVIKIWCMVDQPSRLLINKADKKAPRNYIDIRNTKQPTEVILWILRDKLPTSYHEENVSFILRETKYNFEICGICTRNLDIGLNNDSSRAVQQTQRLGVVHSSWLELGTEFKHRDMNRFSQYLKICIERHTTKTYVFQESEDPEEPETLEANLPPIGANYKWRLIHMNSDFSFLYFTKTHYSVKYVDLCYASHNGNATKDSTLMLHSSKLKTAQDHPKMGIYFDQNQPNKLFVGPYLKTNPDENTVETLRYFNQQLVVTDEFNKLRGKDDYRSGYWLVEETPSADSVEPQSEEYTIDLTLDETPPTKDSSNAIGAEETSEQRKRKRSASSRASSISESDIGYLGNLSLTHDNAHIEIVEAPPRKPEEFNRFVITNIPHFGYLGAFKHAGSDKIDVSWPFENKLLRFPSVQVATEFLQERLSSLLLPVPDTFKVHVIVVNHLDTDANLPIDANVLSGHYICGEFGYYNILTITPQICLNKLGKTREELLRMFAKRCQVIVKKRSDTLAALLHLSKPADSDGIIYVNNKAVIEIRNQKMLERQLVNQKTELMIKKRRLATELFMYISELPERERNEFSKRFRSILTPRRDIEPIEIVSDSEEDKARAEEERGPPVLEAEPPTMTDTHNRTQPLNDKLPVLEKQVPTGTAPPHSINKGKEPVAVPLQFWSISALPSASANPNVKLDLMPINARSLLRTPAIGAPPIKDVSTVTTPPATAPIQAAYLATTPHGKYLKGIKVVKKPNGQLLIVPDKNSGITSSATEKVILKGVNIRPEGSRRTSNESANVDGKSAT
ncbi:unnamed protein product [Acanthoscelides obtectus]|uniref:MGA conserved domain-containing protein n=1 Tax=Acanthoscelides obtectus TaxID=200917 RepID=A0A9P0KYZ6_ACAOB|nr:unnamed protein product [Acanthoscelides obtectus]CAK1637788.1 MAX gene-associated protein [Acanthoscelides obtectus]